VVKGTTLVQRLILMGTLQYCVFRRECIPFTATMIGILRNRRRYSYSYDQTAPVNIELPQETIQMGDIVVMAERNVLKKDVSTSVVAIQPDEISSMPVTSVTEVIGLQAGVEED